LHNVGWLKGATPVGFTETIDVPGLLINANRPAIEAALDKEITLVIGDAKTMTRSEKEAAASRVQSQILPIERIEAFWTWAAMEDRLRVECRGDMSPQAILGIELRTVPPHRRAIRARGHSYAVPDRSAGRKPFPWNTGVRSVG